MNTRNLRFRSNRVRDIIALFHEELDVLYSSGEVDAFIEILFEEYLGWDRVKLLLNREMSIDQSDLLRFHWALEDLNKYHPIQHIVGHTDFCGCRISVSPDVLVPRPETEEIVNWVVNQFSTLNSQLSILDLCTGSGCIAIALKRAFPQAEVTAVDLSDKALVIARQNADNNNVAINFVHDDVLDPQFRIQNSKFNIIISNPPYVMEKERSLMRRNVLDYDPAMALFVPDDDPLRFYRAIATIARQNLTPDGQLVVEINEALADETCAVLEGFNIKVHNDFRGRPRWISAKLNTDH